MGRGRDLPAAGTPADLPADAQGDAEAGLAAEVVRPEAELGAGGELIGRRAVPGVERIAANEQRPSRAERLVQAADQVVRAAVDLAKIGGERLQPALRGAEPLDHAHVN